MPEIKLAKLPDRTPAKLTIHILPDLGEDLSRYVALYRDAYGEVTAVTDLIPTMLSSFLASDREFMKARKNAGKPVQVVRA